jgi:protein TonB
MNSTVAEERLQVSDNIIPDDQEFVEELLPEPIESEITLDTQALRLPPLKIIKERPKPSDDLQPTKIVEKAKEIFDVVEEMPRFPGCEDLGLSKDEKKSCADKALLEYIYSKIKYPELARIYKIEGTVVLELIVEKSGEITGIGIIKEIGGGCGKEVVRVVNAMPDWLPGKQRGKEVRVRYKLPVKFTLQ